MYVLSKFVKELVTFSISFNIKHMRHATVHPEMDMCVDHEMYMCVDRELYMCVDHEMDMCVA